MWVELKADSTMKDKDKWTSKLIYRKNLKWNWDGGEEKKVNRISELKNNFKPPKTCVIGFHKE